MPTPAPNEPGPFLRINDHKDPTRPFYIFPNQRISALMLSMIFTPKRLIATVLVWVFLGLGFALVQFALTEITYRIATSREDASLQEVSDLIAWPAGKIYSLAEKDSAHTALRSLAQSNKEGSTQAREFLNSFRTKYDQDEEWTTQMSDFLNTQEITTEVSKPIEYLIYVGVCLAWGFLVFLGGSLLSLAILRAIPEPRSSINTQVPA
jgi:hypothetical protein